MSRMRHSTSAVMTTDIRVGRSGSFLSRAASGASGPLSESHEAATAANVSSGTPWLNLGNITLPDGLTVDCAAASATRFLRCTDYGFTIPGGATIVGVEIGIRCSVDGALGVDNSVQLSLAGAAGGFDEASATVLPPSLAYRTYGGPADLWGGVLTPADVNDALFGVYFKGSGADIFHVDNILMTVYYTP